MNTDGLYIQNVELPIDELLLVQATRGSESDPYCFMLYLYRMSQSFVVRFILITNNYVIR